MNVFETFFQYDFEAVEWGLQQFCHSAFPSSELFNSFFKPLNPAIHVCTINGGSDTTSVV
jgi:hypothetical protein